MKNLAILAGAALLLSGCAAAGLTVASAGAGVAMGNGVEHTMSGIGYKTFTAPVSEVRVATLQSLRRMDITIDSDSQTPDGWALTGTARDRTIEIELESLTARATRMRVVANKGQIFFKDAATSTEIILQTAQSLDELSIARAKEAPPTPAKQAATKGGKRT